MINNKCYQLVPVSQEQMLNVLNSQGIQKTKTKKERICDFCEQSVSVALNMHGSCNCTIHQRCAKNPDKSYMDCCPVCSEPFNEKTLNFIEKTQQNIKNAQRGKQVKKQELQLPKTVNKPDFQKVKKPSRQSFGPSSPNYLGGPSSPNYLGGPSSPSKFSHRSSVSSMASNDATFDALANQINNDF